VNFQSNIGIEGHMAGSLSELSRIAVTRISKADLTADVPDDVLAQRILDGCDPLFLEELGLALTRQRVALWIQAERRRVERRMLAKQRGADQKAG
jgi:hypothetical protein